MLKHKTYVLGYHTPNQTCFLYFEGEVTHCHKKYRKGDAASAAAMEAKLADTSLSGIKAQGIRARVVNLAIRE